MGPASRQQALLASPRPCRGSSPKGGAGSGAGSSSGGVWGFLARLPLGGRPREAGRQRVGSPEGLRALPISLQLFQVGRVPL